MNTSELQKKHEKVYQEFFSGNSIVVSAPFLINWSGDLHPDFNGVSIKQKIPLRLYVGAQKSPKGGITLGSVLEYDHTTDSYETVHEISYWMSVAQEMEKNFSTGSSGVIINIISEVPRTLGLGYHSIFPLCLGAIVMMIQTPESVKEFITLPTQHIQHSLDTNDNMKELLRISMELDPVIYGKITAGMKIASFFDGIYPTLGFRDKSDHVLPVEELSSMKLYGSRIDELGTHTHEPEFPFDCGIIVSDKPVLRDNFKKVSRLSNVSDVDKQSIKEEVDHLMMHTTNKKINSPRFYHFLEGEDDNVYKTYGAMMGAISIETLNIFRKIIFSHYSDELSETFFSTINKLKYGNGIVRKVSSYFERFIDALVSAINLPPYEFACFPNNTLVREGTITYVSHSEKNRKIIASGVEQIRHQYPGAYTLYASAIDGLGETGFVVDQYLEVGINSKHIAHGAWELKDVQGKRTLGEFDTLIGKGEYDLILDLFNGKMYHKGERLTSEYFSSQSTTIELINLLFSSPTKEISNKDMSYSSYSKNKNELTSKVIAPLEKRSKKATGKDCVIKATGSLGSFIVYMKHNALKIGFLDKKR